MMITGRRVATADAARAFAPPSPPASAVARPRLLSLLDVAVQQRLAVVVAPPGYGKTVLLSQWAAVHRSPPVRWLALEPGDDRVDVLAERLAAALGLDGVSPTWPGGIGPTGAEGEPSAFAPLLARLDRLGPTILVLDDFGTLTAPTLLDELARFIEQAPRSLHIVLATRADPPARFYRLGLSDTLVELRQDDLAFTTEEAAQLIDSLTSQHLSPAQIDRLVARTEGWGVGLHLAGLSLREHHDVEGFIETFAGDDRHVADYLIEKVLSRQPADVRGFLLSTSVVEQMCGSLCDALTGQPGGQAMLEELDRRAMFISRSGSQVWFRYHQLFRTLLRQHLHAADPGGGHERDLLQRAATWHLAKGNVEDGVGCLIRAGAWQDVLDSAKAHGTAMYAAGKASTVSAWIARVPEEARCGQLDVALLQAAGLVFGGEATQAHVLLGRFDTMGEPTPQQLAVARLLGAYARLNHGDPAEAVAEARVALRHLDEAGTPPPDVFGLTGTPDDVAAGARAVEGAGLVYQGRFSEARQVLALVPDDAPEPWLTAALGSQALLEACSGRLGLAERLGNRALTLARQVGLDHDIVADDALLALASVARQRGQLARSRELVQDAARWSGPERARVAVVLLATEQALLALAEGQPEAGLATLAARWAADHPTVPPWCAARRRAVEADLLVAIGDLAAASGMLDQAAEETTEVVAARVGLAIAHDDVASAEALIGRWNDEPAPRSGLERRLWVAVIAHLRGDTELARRLVVDVVAEAEPEGNVELFRNGHIVGLARALYRETPSPFLRSIVDQPAVSSRIRPAKELVEQLTEREHMVLRLLPTRMSNLEIADALGVSVNTVKTHLKHIYRKLGVEDRSGAISAADRLRLW